MPIDDGLPILFIEKYFKKVKLFEIFENLRHLQCWFLVQKLKQMHQWPIAERGHGLNLELVHSKENLSKIALYPALHIYLRNEFLISNAVLTRKSKTDQNFVFHNLCLKRQTRP